MSDESMRGFMAIARIIAEDAASAPKGSAEPPYPEPGETPEAYRQRLVEFRAREGGRSGPDTPGRRKRKAR